MFDMRREEKRDPQAASTPITPVLRLSQILRCSLTTYLRPRSTRMRLAGAEAKPGAR